MASMDTVKITRQELYDHVWTTPMRTLAGEWGLSDVGLAKICKRHEIPRPAQGHWVRKQHGHRVRRTPLPAVSDVRLETITISPVDRVDGPTIADSKIAQLILQESEADWAIVVREGTQLRHPFVRATKESLKGQRPNDYGRVSPHWQFTTTHFDLQVSPRNVTRALRILQTLVSEMQARGYTLQQGTDKGRHPFFDVLGESFQVTIRESSKRSERQASESKSSLWSYNRYDYTPTGILELHTNYGSCWSDATLRDTKSKPLEKRLNEVIIAMLRTVDRKQQEAELRRTEAIQKAERKKIAIEQEIESRSDSARIQRLKHLAGSWETHRRMSAFVNAVRYEADARASEVDPGTIDWLTWADAFLREIDPLCGGEDLPVYSLYAEEREQLRRECEADWCGWTEAFRRRER